MSSTDMQTVVAATSLVVSISSLLYVTRHSLTEFYFRRRLTHRLSRLRRRIGKELEP